MRKQIEERLSTLQAEFKAGQEILAELETRQSNVRSTLWCESAAPSRYSKNY